MSPLSMKLRFIKVWQQIKIEAPIDLTPLKKEIKLYF